MILWGFYQINQLIWPINGPRCIPVVTMHKCNKTSSYQRTIIIYNCPSLSWLMGRMTISMIHWYRGSIWMGVCPFKGGHVLVLSPDLNKPRALTHRKQLSSAPLLIKRLLSIYTPVQTVKRDDSCLCGALLPAEKWKRQQARLCRPAAQCGTLPLTQQLVFR